MTGVQTCALPILALVVASMIAGLAKVWRHLTIDYPAGLLRLCFIITIAVYNYTEATFKGVSNMWLLFLLGVLEAGPRRQMKPSTLQPAREGGALDSAPVPSFRKATSLSGRRLS